MSEILVELFSRLPDIHQNPLYAAAMGKIGWTTVGDPGSYLYLRRLGPIGIAKIQHPTTLDLVELKRLRRRYHLLTTYVEPGLSQPDLGKIGISVEPFANSCTSLLDLTLSSKELLGSFKSKTRYNISYAKRQKKLTIISRKFADLSPLDLATFKVSRESWTKRKGVIGYEESFITALLSSFGDSGELHFAYRGDSCVATLMILYNGQAAVYYSAFAEEDGYHLYAPTLLTWTAITRASQHGCTIFDFGGIYDPRYPKMYKKWQGFTRFKEGFSPIVVQYPPTQLLLGW